MYGQSTYLRANSRFASIDAARVAGIADDEAADDEHAVPVQQLYRRDGCAASRAAAFALGVLGLAP